MIATPDNRAALFAEHEHLIGSVIRRLNRRFPQLHLIDPESIGHFALCEAVTNFAKVRKSFPAFAIVHIRARLLCALRTYFRRKRICMRREVPLEVLTAAEFIRDHTELYAAIDKLPSDMRRIVAWKFGLIGDGMSQAELAAKEGLSVKALCAKLADALDRLRELLV